MTLLERKKGLKSIMCLEKDQMKSQVSRGKEIIKSREEISEIEKIGEKINETNI